METEQAGGPPMSEARRAASSEAKEGGGRQFKARPPPPPLLQDGSGFVSFHEYLLLYYPQATQEERTILCGWCGGQGGH